MEGRWDNEPMAKLILGIIAGIGISILSFLAGGGLKLAGASVYIDDSPFLY